MNGKATVLSLQDALFLVGIDWAGTEHAVCVLDPTGGKIAAFTVAGLGELTRRLGKLADTGLVPVAIERPDGRLVDALLEAGYPVVPVKPNAIKTWREAEVLSGAKSDPGDAHVIADFNAAQILAEWGDARAAFDHPDAVAALAGITPVTKASGKQHGVSFRWACNKRLRVAITTFAANSRFSSTWAADIYHRARASGKDHPHTTRVLARAWVRVMWRCWQNGTPYHPALHGGAQHQVEQPLAA